MWAQWILVGCAVFANILTCITLFMAMGQATSKLLGGFITAHQQNLSRLAKIEEKLELIYQWWVKRIDKV